MTAAHQPLPPSVTDAGFNKDISFLAGSNFADGKGNATVYATYLKSAPAIGEQYDYAGCTLNTPSSLPGPGKLKCGGSSSSATGRFLELGNNGTSAYATLADKTVDAKTGAFRNYTSADSYNYGALSFLQRGAERYTAGSFLNYDVNDRVNVYSETMFARNTSESQLWTQRSVRLRNADHQLLRSAADAGRTRRALYTSQHRRQPEDLRRHRQQHHAVCGTPQR